VYASSAHIDSCFSAVISMSSMDVYRVAREGKRSADLALINGPWAADAVIQGSRISSRKPCKTTLP
jgi:hypothetical protein